MDPMKLTADHCENWRRRYDILGSSQSRSGRRKTFEINATGNYLVKEYQPATTLTLYDGGDEAEALRIYDET